MIPGKDGGYTPRGIRNRNPGNIRATQPDTWQGQTGIDPKGFAVFKAPRDGLRALGLTLIAYQQRHGIYTLLALTHRYAPASDHNQPTAYAEALLDILHTYPEIHPPCSTTAVWHWTDPLHLPPLMAAIVQHENGQQPYPETLISQGATDALVDAPTK